MRSIDLTSMDLNLLVTFEAIFQTRSVTLAAQQLFLGQPAVSAALGRLRSVFEDELFIRIGREMQPTRKALEIAPGILNALQQIRQTLQASQTFDPTTSEACVSIGSSDYTSCVIIPKLLATCQQQFPGINIRLLSFEKDQVASLLEEGIIDLALGVFPDPPPYTRMEPLFQDQLVGIAPQGHSVLSNPDLSLETFAGFPQALITLRRDETGYVDQVLATAGLKRRIVVTTPHSLVLVRLLQSSDLIASIPGRMAHALGGAWCWGAGSKVSDPVNVANVSDDAGLDDPVESPTLGMFQLPFESPLWTVSMLWSQLADHDPVHIWLRETLKQIVGTL